MRDGKHVRSRKAAVRCTNDDFFESEGRLADVFQEKIALRALTAIDTLVIPQDILNLVEARGAILAVFAAIAALDLHPQAARHDLALVAVLEAGVLV